MKKLKNDCHESSKLHKRETYACTDKRKVKRRIRPRKSISVPKVRMRAKWSDIYIWSRILVE
ncbi:hypothetical protein SESBI_34231 [Sesbania bispinosa]|nr:hypothetical protein SESBI_34231 [Sesbania bispinosa]